MLIKVHTTPNPDALKFVVGQKWIEFVWECSSEKEAKKSPLALKLWHLPGVAYLMFGHDFVSVVKDREALWEILQTEIIELLSEFLLEEKGLFSDVILDFAKGGNAAENDQNQPNKPKYDDREYTEFEQKIIKTLEEKVQPALEFHGGWVQFVSFENGILLIDMQGACKGCPSSLSTLKDGIENLMRYYFPEISEVCEVSMQNGSENILQKSDENLGENVAIKMQNDEKME
jgi:Fe-S cluster biogenesis protein NfuA